MGRSHAPACLRLERMARITIDGREYEVRDGDNLLAAALSLGLGIPYFCWHPALGSAGACRQCAVKQYKDADDTRGRLVMACMTPVQDAGRFSIDDAEARDFRRSIIEWLMTTHPHDCPVCDEGGECHLQDMTVMTGHVYRRHRFPKRTHLNQDLGPFVAHEMNRCIACYRCVRFYRDYAGGTDLDAFASKQHVYFGRGESGVLESPFAGNLVEVCPTGVFTDKTLKRHYTRKWDLQSAPSVCVHCGVGCNTFVGERYGAVRRISNRYHPRINGYFLCDRGRFGYEHLNAEHRLQTVSLKRDGMLTAPGTEQGLATVKGGRLVGIGSPRATLEANHALRALVGEEGFSPGLNEAELALAQQVLGFLRAPPAPLFSLAEAAGADAVIVLGEDVEQTAPRLSLALRQALRQQGKAQAERLGIPDWQDVSVRDATRGITSPLFVITPVATALDRFASTTLRVAPAAIAAIACAVTARLDKQAPRCGEGPADPALVKTIAGALLQAERPLVVTGSGQGSAAVLTAAANLARALVKHRPRAGFVCTVPECNTVGAALLGGMSVEAALAKVQRGECDTLLVVENDLFRRVPEETVHAALNAAGQRVAVDVLANRTTALAELVLPAAGFAEDTGTLINHEGRAQRRFAALPAGGERRATWRWMLTLGEQLGRPLGFTRLSELQADLAARQPVFARIGEAAPADVGRAPHRAVPRQPLRYSGRTAMWADATVFEPPPPTDVDAPLRFSMEGYGRPPPAGLEPRYWVPGWNSPQALTFYQREINGPLQGGEAGVLLFDSTPVPGDYLPLPEEARGDHLVGVPVHHLFGGEELSSQAPAVASLIPVPHLLLARQTAERKQLTEGDLVKVHISGRWFVLPVRFADMAADVVGLPVNMGPVCGLSLPVPLTIESVR